MKWKEGKTLKKRIFYSLSMCAMLMLSGCAQHHNDNKEVKVSLPREFNTNQLDAQGFDAPMPMYNAIYQPLVTYGKMARLNQVLLHLGKLQKTVNTTYFI